MLSVPPARALGAMVASREQQGTNSVRRATARDKAASPFKPFQQFSPIWLELNEKPGTKKTQTNKTQQQKTPKKVTAR